MFENATEKITIRVSKEEKKFIWNYAKELNISPSRLIRSFIKHQFSVQYCYGNFNLEGDPINENKKTDKHYKL